MFGTLRNVFTNDWLKDENIFTIKLSTEYENTLWQVFSVNKIKNTSDYIKVSFSTDNKYKEFLNLISKRSKHNFNTKVNTNDRILTLSTCYDSNNKIVLHAKLIKRQIKTQD